MIKITKIIGVESKGGKRSKTGSFVSMGITDRVATACQDYFLDLADGEEPSGKVKKIELVIYEDGDELETIEALRAENREMRDFIDNLDTVVKSSKALIDCVVIEDEEEEILEWEDGRVYEQGDKVLYDGVLSQLGETGFFPIEKENLPPNQRYLDLYDVNIPNPCKLCLSNLDGKFCKLACRRNPESKSDVDLFEVIPMSQRIYDKPCKCETSAIVNGKCANCGGV